MGIITFFMVCALLALCLTIYGVGVTTIVLIEVVIIMYNTIGYLKMKTRIKEDIIRGREYISNPSKRYNTTDVIFTAI